MCILATMGPADEAANRTTATAGQKRRHSPNDASDPLAIENASPLPGGSTGLDQPDPESVGPMLKARKLDASVGEHEAAIGGDFVYEMAPPSVPRVSPPAVSQDPLHASLSQLFKQFAHFVCVDQLSPRIYFIAQFLQLLVQMGGDQVKPLLRLAPAGLMQNLLRVTVCDEYTAGFLLRYVFLLDIGGNCEGGANLFSGFCACRVYDLDTVLGRRTCMADLSLLRNIQLRKECIDL